MDALLIAIETFDWPKRTSVPASALAFLEPDSAERALVDLQVDLADQDCVDALFARALPLMLRLSLHPKAASGPALLAWLVNTALDGHEQWLTTGFHPKREGAELLRGSVQRHFRAAYGHLEVARPALVAALQDARAEMRAAASFALGWLGAQANEVVGPVATALIAERDERTEATLAVALGFLARFSGFEPTLLRERLERPTTVARAAAWGVAVANEERLPNHVFSLLLSGWTASPELGLIYGLDDPAQYLALLGGRAERSEALEAAVRARLDDATLGSAAARFLLERADRPPPKELLETIAGCAWADKPHRLQGIGLPPIDQLREELGLPPRNPNVLDRPLVVDGVEGTIRTLWRGSVGVGGSPDGEALARAIPDGLLVAAAVYAVGLDRAGAAVQIRPMLCARMTDRLEASWTELRAVLAALPQDKERHLRLRNAFAVATALAPCADEAEAALMDGYVAELEGTSLEAPGVSRWLRALPRRLAEPRVLASMRSAPLRYSRAHPTEATATLALEQIVDTLQRDAFGRRGKKRKERAAMKRRRAVACFEALGGHHFNRVAELARVPIKHGSHDDRDLFVHILILGLPETRPLLEGLRKDTSAPIRRLVEEALG